MEQKIDELEDNQYMTMYGYIYDNELMNIWSYSIGTGFHRHKNIYYCNVPKNVDFAEIEIKSNVLSYGVSTLITLKKFSFMDCDFSQCHCGKIASLSSECGHDKYEMKHMYNKQLERILKFINLKKIIINCEGNMYNQPVVQSIVNFLESHLLKKSIPIEINNY